MNDDLLPDEDAAKELCGTDPTDKKYLMLKSRVRARLVEHFVTPGTASVRRMNRQSISAIETYSMQKFYCWEMLG